MDGYVVSVERVIPAPASAIYGLIADPSQHPLIDGSGAVREAAAGSSPRLAIGDHFGMSMKMGIPYQMVNTVVECEPDRLLAWKAVLAVPVVGSLIGGRIWRYELREVDGGTRVKESWDITHDHQRALLRLGKLPTVTAANMNRTLERIEEILAA